eukprot:8674563-Pyramimonas_sp.AAC.1
MAAGAPPRYDARARLRQHLRGGRAPGSAARERCGVLANAWGRLASARGTPGVGCGRSKRKGYTEGADGGVLQR